MIRRLGKRWQQLHRLVYIAAIGGVIHFYWLVKADIRRPAQYGAVLALLLGYRLAVKLRPRIAARFSSNASLVRTR
jgi:methionine sulfoxide reductase heme-binding subunit